MSIRNEAPWKHQTTTDLNKPRAGVAFFDDEQPGHTTIYVLYVDGTLSPARSVCMDNPSHAESVLNAWRFGAGKVDDNRTPIAPVVANVPYTRKYYDHFTIGDTISPLVQSLDDLIEIVESITDAAMPYEYLDWRRKLSKARDALGTASELASYAITEKALKAEFKEAEELAAA